MNRATPDLRSAGLHLTIVGSKHRKANRMSHIGNLMSQIKSDVTGHGVEDTVDSANGAPRDTIDEWGVFASTTEALTLTLLTELVRRAGEHPEVPSSVAAIVGGVYAAELDHWRFTSKHWEPMTTRFWIPDGFYGGEGDALDLTAVGRGVAAGEHLFVNTYLLGVTTFAAAGESTYARYAAEIAANESEHRLLGQTLAGANPPNDLGFADYEFDRISQIAAAAQSAGFGFGEQGTAAGRFYDLPQSPMAPAVQISSNEPR